MFGLVVALALAAPSAMPSASVSCPDDPASCDGAWPAPAGTTSADAAPADDDDDGPRDYATPAVIDCPSPPEPPAPAASGECSDAPLNLWFRVSRTPDSERPAGGLAPVPRSARARQKSSCRGSEDVAHFSAPDVQPMALFALPGLVPASAQRLVPIPAWAMPARALAPPDRPPRV